MLQCCMSWVPVAGPHCTDTLQLATLTTREKSDTNQSDSGSGVRTLRAYWPLIVGGETRASGEIVHSGILMLRLLSQFQFNNYLLDSRSEFIC